MIGRREFLGLASASGLVGALPVFAAEEFRGRVTGNGKPLSGVAVTNGLDVVPTGRDGTFVLPRRGGERFLSVTVPSGWRAERFYLPVAEGTASYDFALRPWAASEMGRELRFVHIADSEIGRIGAREKAMLGHVKDVADRYEAAFIVHTGDICYPTGLRSHAELMNDATTGRPTFYCVGNHDLVKEGEYGEWLFESLYGPSWHSFDACGVHFCITPMENGDVKPSYGTGDVAAWIRNDLALVPKGRPVVLFNHYFGTAMFGMKNIRKGEFSLGGFDLTGACNLVGLVYGHLHINQFRRFGKIAAIQTSNPQFGGVELSPAAVRVIKADRTGRLTSELNYTPQDRWSVVTEKPKDGWIVRAPGPVYLGTPSTDGRRIFVGTLDDDGLGTGSVTAYDLATGRTAWSAKVPASVKNRTVVCGKLVVAQDSDGVIRAFETATGKVAWTYDPENRDIRPYEFGLGLDAEKGVVYAEVGQHLMAFDGATGRPIWTCKDFTIYGSTASSVAVGCGLATGEMQWHGLNAVDQETGRRAWSRDTKGPYKGKEKLRWRSGEVAFADGKAYVHGGKWLLELDAKTGETLREREYKQKLGTTSRPLVTPERIFLGSCDGGLIALDRATLDIAWTGKVGEALVVNGSYCSAPQHQVATNPVAIGAKTVCAAAGDGTIRFWDAATGKEKRRIETGAPHFSAPLLVGRRLVVADFAGYVRCFDLGNI